MNSTTKFKVNNLFIQSFSTNYVEKTANYTCLLTDHTINCLSNSFIVSLPIATSGKIYVIKNSGTGFITILPNGLETIDGNDSVLINTQWESLTLQGTSSGSWIII